MTHEQLASVINRLVDFMESDNIRSMTINWQGGEIMTIPVRWFEIAYRLISDLAASRGVRIDHGLQTNMIGYTPKWNDIIRQMFGNYVGTSMDFPNLYRKPFRGDPDDYTRIWQRKVNQARESGIGVGVIAVINRATIELGARSFYSHFVDELGLTDLQVNTPFPGGEENLSKIGMMIENDDLATFFRDLTDVWLEHGQGRGVSVGPIDQIIERLAGRHSCLPCIWQANCVDEFIAIDARGFVAQCDCWVTSYPEYFFGNIYDSDDLYDLLRKSPSRQKFADRPIAIVDRDCIDCDYLSMCHGGCPVRTFTIKHTLNEKDPFCSFYRSLFRHCEQAIGSRVLDVQRH